MEKITKIETNDYGSFSTLYISGSKETIADILNYATTLNLQILEQIQTTEKP